MPQRPQFRSLLTHPANFAYFNASAAQESLNCTSFGDSPPQVTFSKCLLHLHPISAWRLSHEIPSPTSYLICTSISPVFRFAKAGLLRIIGVLSSLLLPAFTGTDIIATMSPSDFSHRIIPDFPSRLYLPYLFRGRYEISLGHPTNHSSSSRP